MYSDNMLWLIFFFHSFFSFFLNIFCLFCNLFLSCWPGLKGKLGGSLSPSSSSGLDRPWLLLPQQLLTGDDRCVDPPPPPPPPFPLPPMCNWLDEWLLHIWVLRAISNFNPFNSYLWPTDPLNTQPCKTYRDHRNSLNPTYFWYTFSKMILHFSIFCFSFLGLFYLLSIMIK